MNNHNYHSNHNHNYHNHQSNNAHYHGRGPAIGSGMVITGEVVPPYYPSREVQGVVEEGAGGQFEDLPYEELTDRLVALYASRTEALENLTRIHRTMRLLEKAIANKDLQSAQDAGKAVVVPSTSTSRAGGSSKRDKSSERRSKKDAASTPADAINAAAGVIPEVLISQDMLGADINKHLAELRLLDVWTPSHIRSEGIFIDAATTATAPAAGAAAAAANTTHRKIHTTNIAKAAKEDLEQLGASIKELLPPLANPATTSVTCTLGDTENTMVGTEAAVAADLDVANAAAYIGEEHLYLKVETLVQESISANTATANKSKKHVVLPSTLLRQGAPLSVVGASLAQCLDALHFYSTSLMCLQLLASACHERNAHGDAVSGLDVIRAKIAHVEGCITDVSQLFCMITVICSTASEFQATRDCVRIFDLVCSLYRASLDGVSTSLIRIMGTTTKLAKDMVPKAPTATSTPPPKQQKQRWRRKIVDLGLGHTLEELLVYASYQLEDYGRWAPVRHAIINGFISHPPIPHRTTDDAPPTATIIQLPIGSSLDNPDTLVAAAAERSGRGLKLPTPGPPNKRGMHIPPMNQAPMTSQQPQFQHPHEYAVDYRLMPLMFPLVTDINGANFSVRIFNNFHTAGDFHVLKLRNVPGALAELAKRRPLREMISEITGVAPQRDDKRGWCPMATIARAIAFAPTFLSMPCESLSADKKSELSDAHRDNITKLLGTPNGDKVMALVATCAHDITLFADKPGLGDVISKSMLTYECLSAQGRYEGSAHSYWYQGDPEHDGDEILHYTAVDKTTPLPDGTQSMSALLGRSTSRRWPIESELCRFVRNCWWWQPCQGFHYPAPPPPPPQEGSDEATPQPRQPTHIPFMLAAACDTVGFRFFERLIDCASLPEEQLLVTRLVFGFPVAPLSESSNLEGNIEKWAELFDPFCETSYVAAQAAVLYIAKDLSGYSLLDRMCSFGKHATKADDDQRPQWQQRMLTDTNECGLDSLNNQSWDEAPATLEIEEVASQQQKLVDEIGSWMRVYRDNHTQQRAVRHGAALCEMYALVFDPIINCCIELSRYRQGCCVIQRCLEYAPDGNDLFYSLYLSATTKNFPEKQTKPPKNAAVPEAGNTHRARLLNTVLANVLHLVNDNFGNYVIQFLMDCTEPFTKGEQAGEAAKKQVERERRLAQGEDPACVAYELGDLQIMPVNMKSEVPVGQRRALRNDIVASQRPYTNAIVRQLLHNIPTLSESKFSSNVIERCLELTSTDVRQLIIDEITDPSTLPKLLRDQYGNYVVQSAIVHASTEEQFAQVRNAVRPMLQILRHSPYGSKIENKLKRRQTRFFLEKQKPQWFDEEEEAQKQQQEMMKEEALASQRGRGRPNNAAAQQQGGPRPHQRPPAPRGGAFSGPNTNSQSHNHHHQHQQLHFQPQMSSSAAGYQPHSQQQGGMLHPNAQPYHFQDPNSMHHHHQGMNHNNNGGRFVYHNGACFPPTFDPTQPHADLANSPPAPPTPPSSGVSIRVGGAYLSGPAQPTVSPFIPMRALSPPSKT